MQGLSAFCTSEGFSYFFSCALMFNMVCFNVVYKQKFDKEVVSAALHEYFVINFKEDCKQLWLVWTPLTMIMFAVVPPRYV